MNKNPLNINLNQPKWETPTVYVVKIDKMLMQNPTDSNLDENGGDDSDVDQTSVRQGESATDYNPFDYNSFDENPFVE